MTISGIAMGAMGMQRASNQFEQSAARIARLGTGLEGTTDIATEMVNVIEAKANFTASAKIVSASSDMTRTLLDILA